MLKRILQALGLLIIIYALGHIYFTQKAPAVAKLGLVKAQDAGFNVNIGKTRVGHYVFRPYVQISHIAVTPKSPKLPNFSVFANKSSRVMLNWWRGQNVTISNRELVSCEFIDTGMKIAASLKDSRLTLSRVDYEPTLQTLFVDKLRLNVTKGRRLSFYTMRNFRLKKRSESLSTSEMHFYTENLSFSGQKSHDVDLIEGHFVYPHCADLNELITKGLRIPNLSVRWKHAKLTAKGLLKKNASGNTELHAEVSVKQFAKALEDLAGHPNVDPQLINAWQTAINVLSAVMPNKFITFVLNANEISLNGKRLLSFKGHHQKPATVPQ